MNSSDLAYARDMTLLALASGGENCCPTCDSDIEEMLSEYDEGIAEIKAMISYCLDKGWYDEVHQWRRLLQQTRVEKRLVKKAKKEVIAYS